MGVQARLFIDGVAEGMGRSLLAEVADAVADAVAQAEARAEGAAETGVGRPDDSGLKAAGAVLIDAIRELENAKNAARAAQAKASVLFSVIEKTWQVQGVCLEVPWGSGRRRSWRWPGGNHRSRLDCT